MKNNTKINLNTNLFPTEPKKATWKTQSLQKKSLAGNETYQALNLEKRSSSYDK